MSNLWPAVGSYEENRWPVLLVQDRQEIGRAEAAMRFFRRLLSGCWSNHDWRRERLKGQYVLVCFTCGEKQPVLAKQKPKYRDRSSKVIVMTSRRRRVS